MTARLEEITKEVKITPAYLMRKYHLTKEEAEKTCFRIWNKQAHDAFYFRIFGMTQEQFFEQMK
jgi:hypothetical protein